MGRAWYGRPFGVASLIFTLSFICATTSAQQTTPQIAEGLAWLQAQIRNDGSLSAESISIATAFQARTETVLTLRALATVPVSLVDGLTGYRKTPPSISRVKSLRTSLLDLT